MTTHTTPPPLAFESEWTHLRSLIDLIGTFAKGQNTNDWFNLWQARQDAELFLHNADMAEEARNAKARI